MKPTIESIIDLFTEKGSQSYGAEAISQLEHALQCASLAEISGQNHELITACLLHDLARSAEAPHSLYRSVGRE